MMENEINIIELKNEKYLVQYCLDKGVFHVVENMSGKCFIKNALSFIEAGPNRSSTRETVIRNSKIERFNIDALGSGTKLSVTNSFDGFNLIQEIYISDSGDALLLRNCFECTGDTVRVKNFGVIAVDSSYGGRILTAAKPEDYRVLTSPCYKIPTILRNVHDGFNLHSLYGEKAPVEPGYFEREYFKYYICDYKNRIKYNEDMGERGQGYYEGFIYNTLEKNILVFGFVTAISHMPRFNLEYDSSRSSDGFCLFEMYNECENIPVNKGETLYSEYAYLNMSKDAFGARDHFADTMKILMNAGSWDYPKAGWCSWHKKLIYITENDVLEQLEFVSRNPRIFPNCKGGFEYIQVDYGWQQNCGRPEVEESRFPHGMKNLADRIHEKGFKAGIWIAPTLIGISPVQEFPYKGYLLKNRKNEPVMIENGMGTYCLDITHPDAVKFALAQVEQIVDEWGYDMIKMDFLEGGMVPWNHDPDGYVYYNKTKSSIEHLRDFCRAVISTVEKTGKDIFISPCGNPVYHMTGIFKSNYIAEDAGYMRWDEHMGVVCFAQTWAAKSNLNGRVFMNNLESVLLDNRPMNEARINAITAALSGGIVFIGDILTGLTDEKLKIYSKILPLYNIPAKPVDFFENEVSSVWNLKVKTGYEKWNVIGIFNWDDTDRDFELDMNTLQLDTGKEYEIFEFWDQEYIGCITGFIKLNSIPGRSDKLLCVREKKNHPWILSTDVHFTQGAIELENISWDIDQNELSGEFTGKRHDDAVISIVFPEHMKAVDFKCNGGQLTISYSNKVNIAKLMIYHYNGENRNFSINFSNQY